MKDPRLLMVIAGLAVTVWLVAPFVFPPQPPAVAAEDILVIHYVCQESGDVYELPLTGERPDKHELAAAVSDAWAAFARNGDPSHSGIPKWEPYTIENRATMLLDVPCHLEIDPAREELDAWAGMEVIP